MWTFSLVEDLKDPSDEMTSGLMDPVILFQLAAALFEDDDDDDNENSFSIRKIKRETGFDEDGRISPASTVMSEMSKQGPQPPTAESRPTSRPPTPVYDPEIQPPFQPGSWFNVCKNYSYYNIFFFFDLLDHFKNDNLRSIQEDFAALYVVLMWKTFKY